MRRCVFAFLSLLAGCDLAFGFEDATCSGMKILADDFKGAGPAPFWRTYSTDYNNIPITRTVDSCVTSSTAFHVSSETSFLKTTHCR